MDLGGSWFLEHVSLKLQFDATLKNYRKLFVVDVVLDDFGGCLFLRRKMETVQQTQFWLDEIEMMDVFHSLLIYRVKVNQQIAL